MSTDIEAAKAAQQAVQQLLMYYRQSVMQPARAAVGVTPRAAGLFLQQLQSLENASFRFSGLNGLVSHITTHLNLLPQLKRALLWWRRQRAYELELPRSRTIDKEIVEELDKQIQIIDLALRHPMIAATTPAKMPWLTDFMPICRVEEALDLPRTEPPKEYDDKFGILLAPSRVLPDFEYFRQQSDIRQVPLAFAFIDIDDFKALNTKHGHNAVDMDLLPQFQQELDSHAYYKGRIYRQGGDEYIAILPNMSESDAKAFLESLQARLRVIEYRLRDATPPTISVGFVVLQPDSILTAREVKNLVGTMLESAKDKGKNCVVGQVIPGY